MATRVSHFRGSRTLKRKNINNDVEIIKPNVFTSEAYKNRTRRERNPLVHPLRGRVSGKLSFSSDLLKIELNARIKPNNPKRHPVKKGPNPDAGL